MSIFKQLVATDKTANTAKKLNTETRQWLYDVLEFRSQIGSLSEGLPQMIKELKKTNAKGVKRADLLENISIKSLRAGNSFSSALQGIVPEDEYILITAAESGGQLGEGLAKARDRMESKNKMQGVLIKTLTTFCLYLLALLGLMALFGNGLFPVLEKITPVEQWPGFSQVVRNVIGTMPVWASILVLVLVIIFFSISASLIRWTNTDKRKWCMNHMPPWNIHRDVTGQAVLESLAALSEVYSESEAIRTLRKAAHPSNLWLRECYDMMTIRIDSGSGNPMLNNPLINQEIQSVLTAVGAGGDKKIFYMRAAERTREKVEKRMARVNQTVNFISLALIGSSVGLLISSFMLVAMNSLNNNL